MGSFGCLKCLLLGFSLLLGLKQTCAQSYKAVVIAYSPKFNSQDLPDEIEIKTKRDYIAFINDVSQQPQQDIVIFPEHGITTIQANSQLRDNLDAYAIYVPAVETTSFKDGILKGISSAAKLGRLYVVINVLEKTNATDVKFYSTDVVFDQDGKLVAKCRKKYLYKEINYDKGALDQKCTFTANFRRTNLHVDFALLFDTDLLTMKDEKVQDVILTSSQPNTLPLSMGLSLQLGYAVRNKVNLLVSGYTKPSEAYGGTGIYLKNGTSWVTLGSEQQLYKDIPVSQQSDQVVDVVAPAKLDRLDKVAYDKLPTLPTTNRSDERKFTDDESYCKLHMDSSGSDITPYKWVALTDSISLLGQQKHVIICGLIKPEEHGTETKIVNGITIEAVSKTNNIIQILPLSLGAANSNLVPVNFKFAETRTGDQTSVTMKLAKQGDVSAFGVLLILKAAVSYGTSIHISSHVTVVGLLCVFIFLWSKFTI